jgi:hypothetical protein
MASSTHLCPAGFVKLRFSSPAAASSYPFASKRGSVSALEKGEGSTDSIRRGSSLTSANASMTSLSAGNCRDSPAARICYGVLPVAAFGPTGVAAGVRLPAFWPHPRASEVPMPIRAAPGTAGRWCRLSLIWPVTYSFNITLALGYIVLGIVLDCKPTPVPRLFIIGSSKKIPLNDAVVARRRVAPPESFVPFEFSSPECMPSMPRQCLEWNI